MLFSFAPGRLWGRGKVGGAGVRLMLVDCPQLTEGILQKVVLRR